MGGDGAMAAAMTLSTGVKALSQIGAGSAARSAGMQQGALYDREAALQEREGELLHQDALYAAIQRAREVKNFRAQQSVQYASSGVTLQGTPILMLEETRRLGQQEVDHLLKRGGALRELMYMKAQNTRMAGGNARAAGRNAFVGGIAGALGTGLEGYMMGQRLGIYGQSSGGGIDFSSPAPGDVYRPAGG